MDSLNLGFHFTAPQAKLLSVCSLFKPITLAFISRKLKVKMSVY